MLARLAAFALPIAVVTGCASYHYQPWEASTWLEGESSSITEIPPEAPQGTVSATSFGVVELAASGGPLVVLHVRLTIVNDRDETPWSLNADEQRVELPGEAPRPPIYVHADASLAIARRMRCVIDLYYALPPHTREGEALARFEFLWKVTTQAREVASRQTFVRVARE